MAPAGRAAAPRPQPQRGQDVTATAAVTLEQIVHGEKVRVDLPTGRTVEIAVPVGTRPGQVIRLKGQGQPGALGGPAGDALVTVEFVPHPLFKVEGDTLRREIAITLDEAVLGAKVRVPTLDGPVTLIGAAEVERRPGAAPQGQGPAAFRRRARRPAGHAQDRPAGRRRRGPRGADEEVARDPALRRPRRDVGSLVPEFPELRPACLG